METKQSKISNFFKVKKNLVSVIVLGTLIVLFGIAAVFSNVLNTQNVDPNQPKASSCIDATPVYGSCPSGCSPQGTNGCYYNSDYSNCGTRSLTGYSCPSGYSGPNGTQCCENTTPTCTYGECGSDTNNAGQCKTSSSDGCGGKKCNPACNSNQNCVDGTCVNKPTKVDGKCGTANGACGTSTGMACTAGDASPSSLSTSGSYTCKGSNGGSDASCSYTCTSNGGGTNPPGGGTPTTGSYNVGGKVIGQASGTGKANTTVLLKSGTNTWETITNANGVYLFEKKINTGDIYSVEITKFDGKALSDVQMTIRTGLPADTGNLGWTWRNTDGRDTNINDKIFEQQKAGNNDCAGMTKYGALDIINTDLRCNFTMTYTGSTPPVQSDADLCKASNGKWKEFTNGCADLCGTTSGSVCTQGIQSLKLSCDCGEEKCWNGTTKSCEKNPTTPVIPVVLEAPACKSSEPSGNTEVKLDADGQITFKVTFDNVRDPDSSWVGIYNMDNLFPNSLNPQPAKIASIQLDGYSQMISSEDPTAATKFRPIPNTRTVSGTTVTYTYKVAFNQLNQIDSKTQKKLMNIRLLDFYGYSPQAGEPGYTNPSLDCAQKITLTSTVPVTKVDALCPSESPKGVCGSSVKMICPDGSVPSVATLTNSGTYVCKSLSGGKDSSTCNYTCTQNVNLPACTRECDDNKPCASGKTCAEVSDDTCDPKNGAKQICQSVMGPGPNCSQIRECETDTQCISKYGTGYTCQDKGSVVGCSQNKQVCEKTGSSGTTCNRTCENTTQCPAGQECKEFANECSSPNGNAQRCVATGTPVCTNGQCSKFDLSKNCAVDLINDFVAFRTEYKAIVQDKTKIFEVSNAANFNGDDRLDIYDFILFRAAFYKFTTDNTCNL